ncbi:aldehyde dehydrogenase [Leifsonia xyli subsp. cynodontis DSM 46306]|jgi:succinate-semialdehyde dehydrogenase/glutarate-semialdehyde dehydrogenase|uniref:Aldehyde dehydrogenase domain-containing protein n=1 Tax=Leifsonia xyli subsp. cynodontis DSM 46306 TaxID=1389489 RepID=U3P996_LEIXC|nr:NAD-dependent succinate-semialdehyde dehydrogenase [Leifsonia xyli]AGW42099.1 aldehyde dehydrogenase [Leifsonia xyli subsp. cynodontis DSM 46306]
MTAEREKTLLASIPTGLHLDGEWRESSSGVAFEVLDPATERVLARVADATPADGQAALAAADAAQPGWARTAPRERAEILRRAFELVTARTEDFALTMTLEMGKPLAEARGEVAYGAEFLRWFSEEAVRVSGRYATAPDGANRLLVLKRPVGPSLFITPWNFPLAMATRKIAPAIAAGCTMVLKPAALTPLTALLLTSVLEEAGLPKGVLNVIPTSRAGAVTGPLIKDARLRKLSFTGSTEVGRRLIADSADQVLRVSMELGGNAPFLVFEDADIPAAVDGAVHAKMRNGGEACVAANRFLVQEDVAAEFAAAFAARIAAFEVGRGTEPGVTMGPLVDAATRDKVEALVAGAVADRARIAVGGSRVDGPGYFYQPTVLTDVPSDARILAEEIFGPVAPLTTFRTEEEAIRLANASEFGLVSFAFTRDLARGLRLAERLDTGMLGLNAGVVSNPAAPFGGVKQSGLGREGGFEGIEEYLETRYVGIADPFAAKGA